MSLEVNNFPVRVILTSGAQAIAVDYFIKNSDLKVSIFPVTGASFVGAEGTDYSVVGAGNQNGGTVTTIGLASGDTIVIERNMDFEQGSKYPTAGKFNESSVEQDLDERTMEAQQNRGDIDRSIKLPSNETPTDAKTVMESVAERANKVRSYDSLGNLSLTSPSSVAASNALGITYDPVGPGAVASNVQAKLRESVSVKDKGATGGGVANDTLAIQTALDAHQRVFVPNGTYKVKDLVPNNFQIIEFESSDAIFEGVLSTDDIFATTGAVVQTRIFGGAYSDCNNVWTHTGNSALAFGVFKGMKINNCTDGFALSASVGNLWSWCNFGTNGSVDNIAHGLNFVGDGTGQTNNNRIVDCNFFFFSERGIAFQDTVNAKIGNFIERGWFEDGSNHAILIGGACRGVTISTTYFENNGKGANNTDISALASDNSFNSASSEFPILAVGDDVNAGGFPVNAVNNGTFTVVTSTTSKIVVSGATLIDETPGTTVHVGEDVTDVYISQSGTPDAWATSTVYKAKRTSANKTWVKESTLNYIALVDHTSGVFATDLAAGKWRLSGATINEVDIGKCTFNNSGFGQLNRIRNTGSSYFNADNNTAINRADSVFAQVEGQAGFHTRLLENFLSVTGGGVYEDTLFSNANSQQVDWSVGVASGNVTEDDRPHRHFEGGESFAVYTLADDATPSVQGKRLCKTGGTTTITDFDDGRVGQTIVLLSEHAITITDNAAIILNGSGNFAMQTSDSLTLTMFNDQIWEETSRKVNL